MKLYITFLFTLFSVFLLGQPIRKPPTKHEVNSFLKWAIKQNDHDSKAIFIRKTRLRFSAEKLKSSQDKSTLMDKKMANSLCSYFTNEDCEYFNAQESFHDSLWNKIKGATIISDSLMQNDWTFKYSTPIFTLDRKYAIIYYESYLGHLPSEGCTYIYRKSKRKWELCYMYNCAYIF
jgi:hypothetical protein